MFISSISSIAVGRFHVGLSSVVRAIVVAAPFVLSSQVCGQSVNPGYGSQGVSGGTAGPQGQGTGGSAAGSPATGGSGTSTGPGSVNQNRYGGPTIPAPPVSPPAPIGPTPVVDTSGRPAIDLEKLSRSDLCGDYRYGVRRMQDRLSGSNVRRIDFAQRYLAPGFDAAGKKTGLQILAGYQEEMEKPRPNVLLAATYLSMVSTIAITAPVVEQVNAILCIATSPRRISDIVDAARRQRR